MKKLILLFLIASPLFSFAQSLNVYTDADIGQYWDGETFQRALTMPSVELGVKYKKVKLFAGLNDFAGYVGAGVVYPIDSKQKLFYDVNFIVYNNGVYISLPRDWGAEFGFTINKKFSPHIRFGFSTQLLYIRGGIQIDLIKID